MISVRTGLVVAVASAALALSGCTSESTDGGRGGPSSGGSPTDTQGPSASTAQPSTGQPSAVIQSPSPGVDSKEAWGDVKLGAITVDAKSGSPTAAVTITNKSAKRSNYIVDLSITSADGETTLDATIVSAEGVDPGKTAKKTAQFGTTEKLPKNAKLAIVGVARLTPQ